MTESPALPDPPGRGVPVGERMAALAAAIGVTAYVDVCCDLLGGADREDHLDVLPWLTNAGWGAGAPVRDPASWKDYWVRHWGARGLLHVWDDRATPAVVAGLGDEHWRPAETCLLVVAAHDVAGSGDAVAALTGSERSRLRLQAARALGVVGDVEHAAALSGLREDPEAGVRRAAERAWAALAARLDLPARDER